MNSNLRFETGTSASMTMDKAGSTSTSIGSHRKDSSWERCIAEEHTAEDDDD